MGTFNVAPVFRRIEVSSLFLTNTLSTGVLRLERQSENQEQRVDLTSYPIVIVGIIRKRFLEKMRQDRKANQPYGPGIQP